MSGYSPEGIDDAFVQDAGPGAPGPDAPRELPALGVLGWLRWGWRQLTSMRVALLLLMLLAVAAVPGSTIPQRPQDPAKVVEFFADNPQIAPWLDRLQMFDVFGSAWFSAIYLLLFISLVGCIVPRARAHASALRSRPPRTPRRLGRYPAQGARTYAAAFTPEQVADAAAAQLRGRGPLPRFRVERGTESSPGVRAPEGADGPVHVVAAERGYLRETGNIVFHLALVGLLISVGLGQAFQYRGQAIVVQDRGFANSVSAYDTFTKGPWFREEALPPFTMVLDRFTSSFTEGPAPVAKDFTAFVTVTDPLGTRAETVKVNHPLVIEGAKVYLQGNGYAPRLTVRDAAGNVTFAGAVPFIPEDQVYTSRGVVKVPDVVTGEQIGLVGYLLPTAQVTPQGMRSLHPDLLNPVVVLTAWTGDLGLDDGVPQNVYELETEGMTQAMTPDGQPVTLMLTPGQTVDLPDGLGTLTLDDLPRFVALDLRHDPALTWIATFAFLAIGGLMLSLFTPRRRVWLRVRSEDAADGGPRTVVEVAGLARTDDTGLQPEVDALLTHLDSRDPAPDDRPAIPDEGEPDEQRR